MRSAFVQWPVLVDRRDQLLDELHRYTALDTIELSDFTLDWDATQLDSGPEVPGELALPASGAFGDLPVPLAPASEYERLHATIERTAASDFAIACNITPFYLTSPRTASLGCIDIDGRQVPGLRNGLGVYGCPSREEVVAYGEAMARAFIAAWPALDVLTINHAEFPLWPQRHLEEVLTCFCDGCRARAAAQNLDLERVADDLRALGRALRRLGAERRPLSESLAVAPDFDRWLAFRREIVSEAVERVAAAARAEARARDRSVRVALEAQLPVLAPFVGTDVSRLARSVDFVVAKFPDYIAGGILPWVAEQLAADDAGRLVGELRAALALGPGPECYEPALLDGQGLRYGNAFDPAVFDLQLPLLAPAREHGPVHAYLWKYGGDDADLGAKLRAAQERGFEGYFLWVWNRDLTAGALQTWPRTAVQGGI